MDAPNITVTYLLSYDYTFNTSATSAPHRPDGSSKNLTLDFFRVLQICVAILGVVGNSLVLKIISKTRGVHWNQTNFLIGNQSAADLFSSVQLILFQLEYFLKWSSPPPFTLLGGLYCFLWEKRLLLFGSYAVSTFNLTMLSLERYFAVVHPRLYAAKTRKRLFVLIALSSWLLGPFMQVMFVVLHASYTDGRCVSVDGYPFLGVLIFLWDYFVPVCIMTFCFFMVVSKFREFKRVKSSWGLEQTTMTGMSKTTAPSSTSVNHREASTIATTVMSRTQIKSLSEEVANERRKDSREQRPSSLHRRNATITLLIVYVAYVICWTPNQFGFLQYNLGGTIDWSGLFYRIELIMASSNSFINVLIYAFRFKTFQTGMKQILQCSN